MSGIQVELIVKGPNKVMAVAVPYCRQQQVRDKTNAPILSRACKFYAFYILQLQALRASVKLQWRLHCYIIKLPNAS